MFLAIKIEIDFLVFTTSQMLSLSSNCIHHFGNFFLHKIVDFLFHLFLYDFLLLDITQPILHLVCAFWFLNDWFFQLKCSFYNHKHRKAILFLTYNLTFSFLFLRELIYFLPSIYILYSFVFKYLSTVFLH